MGRRVLVIAAHPDDEVLGAGATIAGHVEAGDDVAVVILGEGVRSRPATSGDDQSIAVDHLAIAASEAARRLGARLAGRHALPDNAFDTVPLLRVVQLIEDAVAAHGPDVVYTHHGGDLNIDHAIACRATITATRPTGGQAVELLSFEVRSSTDWSDAQLDGVPFRPTVWVAASPTAVAAKLAALRAYDKEMRPWPHSRSYEAVEALLRHRGAQVGVEAAEAFSLLRCVR